MNTTHLHLLINHLPVFGSILGVLVLIHAMWAKSEPTKIAAYNILILASIGAVVAYFSGESAEDAVEKIQGVSKDMIEEHGDFAKAALAALILLGLVSLVGLFVTIKKLSLAAPVAIIALVIASIGFGIVARTAYLGGQIRHTEINISNPTNNLPATEKKDDD